MNAGSLKDVDNYLLAAELHGFAVGVVSEVDAIALDGAASIAGHCMSVTLDI